MRKAEVARVCLSEQMRLEMLETFCREDERISMSDAKYGTVAVRVRDTLSSLLARNPDVGVYFVVGADKAGMFARWNDSGDFDGRFHLMVFDRGDGVGGVMRSAAIGLMYYASPERAFDIAVECAALTYGNPGGYLPAGLYAAVIAYIIQGKGIDDAGRRHPQRKTL